MEVFLFSGEREQYNTKTLDLSNCYICKIIETFDWGSIGEKNIYIYLLQARVIHYAILGQSLYLSVP